MKVMVVEDERQILEGILRILRRHIEFPCRFFGFSNAQTALKKARDIRPELVIADIVMPEMNGLIFLSKLRDISSDCRFLVISAHQDFAFARTALQLGAIDYLIKPIDKDLLLTHVRDIYSGLPAQYALSSARVLPDLPFINEHPELLPELPVSLKKIMSYLDRNYMKDLSLDDVSNRFTLNANYVSTLFTTHVGESFVTYLHRQRLKKATELLLYESTLSVSDVGHGSGYDNERQLYRAFSRYMNITPGEIRKKAGDDFIISD